MQNKNNKYRDYFAKIVQINDAVFDLLVDVKKNDVNQYVYTITLKENKKIQATHITELAENSVKSGATNSKRN